MAATTSARTIRRSLRMAGELDFRIATVQQWALRPRTQVGQPQKWGAFSYDAERRMHLDERGRKLFRDPFVPTREAPRPADLDLNYGLETFAPGHLAPDRLDALLEVLRSRADADAGAAAQLASNRLITFRGIMTKLCTMLYDDRDGFELNAQMVRYASASHCQSMLTVAGTSLERLSSWNSTAARTSTSSKWRRWKTPPGDATRTKATALNRTARWRRIGTIGIDPRA